MNSKWMYAAAAACMLAACRPAAEKTGGTLTVIDVAGAAAQQTELKISDLGTRIRYVPLETKDSCLIGRNPQIMVLKGQILVQSGTDVYSFDKETGRFMNKIGHAGEDPKGYSMHAGRPYYNERNGLMYFVRQPNALQKYDLGGTYQGKAVIPTPPAMPDSYGFVDTLVVGYYNNIAQQNTHKRMLGLFTEAGLLRDSIVSPLPALPPMKMEDIASISVLRLGIAQAIYTRFGDGTSSYSIASPTTLWNYDGELRFKDTFNDTVYNVSAAGELTPAYVFGTGERRLEPKARWSDDEAKGTMLPVLVLETPRNIFFQCAEDLRKAVNGVYDKQAGTTRMCDEEKGLTDDVNYFLPFRPSACSAQGEYAQLVEAADVVDFLDENPEAKDNSALAPLLKIGEEDNPVVVLVY